MRDGEKKRNCHRFHRQYRTAQDTKDLRHRGVQYSSLDGDDDAENEVEDADEVEIEDEFEFGFVDADDDDIFGGHWATGDA